MKVLVAVYDLEQPRDRWFSGVLRAAAATEMSAYGVGGILYDLSSGPELRVEALDGVDIAPDWIQVGAAMHSDRRLLPRIELGYRSLLCATLADLGAISPQGVRAARRDHYAPRGVRGQTMVNGLDGTGKGLALYFFSKEAAPLSPAARATFSSLATHLATARRLQARLAQGQVACGEIEAVLAPDGEVVHAQAVASATVARQALQVAVRDREEARKSITSEPARILKGWKGLIAERWTLVDDYQRGGHRYVVARENQPAARGPSALSERERQVAGLAKLGRSNKLIAYELGLAHSTVRVLVARACAKLAVPSRAELVARLHDFM